MLGRDEWAAQPEGGELVYAVRRISDTAGELRDASIEEVGSLEGAPRERIARPLQETEDGWMYAEDARGYELPDGRSVSIYRVTRRPTDVVKRVPDDRPTRFLPDTQALANATGDETLRVYVKLRDFPEFDLPLRADTFATEAERAAANEARRARKEERRVLALTRFDEAIAASVGESVPVKIVTAFPDAGWIVAELPGSAVADLAKDHRVAAIDAAKLSEGKTMSGWFMGRARTADRLDADRWHDQGHTGWVQTNGERVLIGITEPGILEDEALMLRDGTGTATRLIGSYRCNDPDNDGNFCELEAGGWDDDPGDCANERTCPWHGTAVTSIAAGDYTDNQACGFAVGDASWTSGCHTDDWERTTSGMAVEASIVFLGRWAGSDIGASATDQFDDAIDLGVDITNGSWGATTGSGQNCNIASSSMIEDQAEAAYDDGILLVQAAGNEDGVDSTVCNVFSPADIPKVFAVNAFDTDTAACLDGSQNDCLLDDSNCSLDGTVGCSARGGGNAVVNGLTYPSSLSLIDLVAPNDVGRVTGDDGTYGTADQRFVGTSAASPYVAGTAALVKDYFLERGDTWINSMGRLHTVMLAMGDRHRWNSGSATSTYQGTVEGNQWYGMGRLKLRLFGTGGGVGWWDWAMHTYALTSSSSSISFRPFGANGLPSGTDLVKCVMMQSEDMSGKSNISEVHVTVEIEDCSSGQNFSTRSDVEEDYKHLVAFGSNDLSTAVGRCVNVVLDPVWIHSNGVTTHTFCYYAAVGDDEVLP